MREFIPHIVASVMMAAGAAAALASRRAMAGRAAGIDAQLHRETHRRRRLLGFVGVGLFLHGAGILVSVLHWSCVHETPMGILGGSGENIAHGQTPIQIRQVVLQRQQKQKQRPQAMTREGLYRILHTRREIELDNTQQEEQIKSDQPGLPNAVGGGATAAGSPHGTVRGKLWLYRLRYDGESWDANPRALPALLQDVQTTTKIEVASRQEVVHVRELPRHSGKYFPRMIFMTGTGNIRMNDEERRNLREYLVNGGLLLADSSGGAFEQHFTRFIRDLLPAEYRMRVIEFDHDVFRGQGYPYRIVRGAPTYREHGSLEARGVFAPDGRLVVFISPGDIGSAWASVAYGRPRRTVETAFQLGTNLVSYAVLNVRDLRDKP